MARYNQNRMPSRLGKRKTPFKNGGRFKRRRYTKRRSWSSTSKSGVAPSYGFRSRKVSPRNWRSMLWKSTLQKSHYRSCYSTSFVVSTNANSALSTVTVMEAWLLGGNAFWVGAGGANALDIGVPIPSFSGDIIVRGGTLGLTVANDVGDSTSQKLEIFLVKSGDAYSTAAFPGNVNTGWDPTLFPEFKTYVGKILLRREVLLENVNSADIKFRIRVQKVDQVNYAAGINSYHWIVVANSPSGTASTFTCTPYFNLSFAADSI